MRGSVARIFPEKASKISISSQNPSEKASLQLSSSAASDFDMLIAHAVCDPSPAVTGQIAALATQPGTRHVAMMPRDYPGTEALMRAGVECMVLPGGHSRDFSVSDIPLYRGAIRRLNPDAVHTHGCATARLAARGIGVPVTLATRYTPRRTPLAPPLRTVYGKVTDCTVAPRRTVEEQLQREHIVPDRIARIPVPLTVDTDLSVRAVRRQALGVPDHAFLVGCRCNLGPLCGVYTLLYAARELLSRSPDYRFLIVGDGSERQQLVQFAGRMGLNDQVRFISSGAADPYYDPAFDLFVSCTADRADSAVPLCQAMAMGIPVIGTLCGEARDYVTQGSEGFLVPAGDAEALAARIDLCRLWDTLRMRMSAAARRSGARFSASAVAQSYTALYEHLLAEKK